MPPAGRLRSVAAFGILGLIAGCGQAGSAPTDADRPANVALVEPVATKPRPPSTASLAKLYSADLARAVAGEKKVPFTGKGGFGGMICAPEVFAQNPSKPQPITLTLPASVDARRRALVVVTPERGLLEIYTAYDGSLESVDLLIPSQEISWAKAFSQSRFATRVSALDGLRRGSGTPEALFIEAGRYRFALINGTDPKLLKSIGSPVKVTAACSFDMTP